MRVALVVNPRSGNGRGMRVLGSALPVFGAAGVDPIVHVCLNGREPGVRARDAAEGGADLVVAVGGDGHAAAVANGLLATGTPLGLLPAGSADDYARALRIPVRRTADAVRTLLQRHVAHVDVVRVTTTERTHHVLNVGGTGFDAVVASRSQRIPLLRGAPRYVVAVLRELPTFSAGRFDLVVDGAEYRLDAMMIAVANGTTYGGGMRVAPAARLDSGRLEVCVVGRVSKPAFVRAFPLVFSGRHVDHPAVTMLSGRRVEISAERDFGMTGDGELIGRLPATFEVLPAALAVAVPPPRAAGGQDGSDGRARLGMRERAE